ncbi:uncharacterized protein LOC121774527 [Salvia splendens]|uniref:uncharacterized protein LOC121774527 n=1 Tax=Salvia splendens TaxID=180675 RepID=UPI001C2650C1|nr:uncharacterized protein LOC121774527 [Salvia splendens]
MWASDGSGSGLGFGWSWAWKKDSDEEYQQLIDGAFDALVEEVQREAEEEAKQEAAAKPRSIHHQRTICRDHAGAHQLPMDDYFGDNPRYTPEIFRQRFRMSQRLFIHIAASLVGWYRCFTLRRDACGRIGLSTYQKCTSAIRQLFYADPADMVYEYLQMGETTVVQVLRQFCKSIQDIFGPEYLGKLSDFECHRLIDIHERVHGFPVMLGSIDCMHW